ncbi:MAG: family 16 glycosylhydrolase [Thermoguttaceae bacterium]|nr:family 16 glycosylhydrolase [Thermoguttaceae bacterium]
MKRYHRAHSAALFVVLSGLIFLGVARLAAAQDAPVCPLGDEYEFAPEFSDEFNGDALDAAKWFDFNPSWRGRKPALFSRDNVAVEGGALHLTARAMKPEEIDVENKTRGYDKYFKAIVKSKARISYGYFEARCRASSANVCNAFWLYDPLSDRPDVKYVEGEYSEEIDILEMFGKPSDPNAKNMVWQTVHRYATPYLESIVNKKKWTMPNKGAKSVQNFDITADFHTYALAWTPTELVWYIDGAEVFRRENDFFTRPLHVVFDCEIMDDWMGEPNPEDLPARFSVDCVRVWKLKGVSEIK